MAVSCPTDATRLRHAALRKWEVTRTLFFLLQEILHSKVVIVLVFWILVLEYFSKSSTSNPDLFNRVDVSNKTDFKDPSRSSNVVR